MDVTRELRAKWLERGESVLHQVPSGLGPETANPLFNPLHEDEARFRFAEAFTYLFDVRLKE